MSPTWRWRRCPQCRNVARASDYTYVGRYGASWGEGDGARRCPHCGYVARTYEFAVVREYHGVPARAAVASGIG